jgi:hypothetical protein
MTMIAGIEKRCWLAGGGLLLLFLLPFLLGWEGAFFADAAVLSYPQQVFFSRCLRAGAFPWWDGATGGGAVPWPYRFSQSSCYPLNWPFLLISGGSPLGSYAVLYQLPLVLHLLLAFCCAFALARRGFRLGRPASLLLALSWSLSPAFALQNGRLAAIFSLAWIPAVVFCLLLFAREGRRLWLLLGVLSSAAAYLGGDFAAAGQVLLVSAAFALALSGVALARGDRSAAVRSLAGGAAIMVIGGCLSGIRWSGLREALRLVEAGALLHPLPPVPRLSPAALAGFLFPGFFGADTGRSLWGPALSLGRHWKSAALPGGAVSCLLIASGLAALRRRRGGEAAPSGPAFREAAPVALVCLVLGIASSLLFRPGYPGGLVAGSPSALIPLAWAILLGVSLEALRDAPEVASTRSLRIFLTLAAAIAVFALACPYRSAAGTVFPGLRGLTARSIPSFLLTLFVGALAAGAFSAVSRFLAGRRRFSALLALAAAEIFIVGYRGFYRSASFDFPPGDLFGERYRGPRDHPAYRASAALAEAFPDGGKPFRRGYFRSAFDDLSGAFGSEGLLGFDLAPLSRRPATAFPVAAAGFPGELIPRDWASNFWRNMSVRYLLTEKPLAPPARLVPTGSGNYYAGALPHALPRWYFQDRWVVADEERERLALLTFDLRAAGYCPREVWHVRPFAHLYPHPPPQTEPEWTKHFADLQEMNRIISVDDSSPNRLVFSLEVKKLSMLVVTDLHHPGWKARADDRGEEVHRVNYLQRGVWCRPGRYTMVMEFLPPSLGPGLALTAAGLLGVILIVSAPSWQKK